MADVAINSDSADIPAVNFAQQGSDPTTPGASRWVLYFKSGGLYARNSAGTVVGPFVAGGDVATDAIWDAAGDLVQGTGANTAARLAIGTVGQVPSVNAGATALEYATPMGRRIAETVIAVATNVVTFNSIPGIYRHLNIVGSFANNTDNTIVILNLQFNADSGANYDSVYHDEVGNADAHGSAFAQTAMQRLALCYARAAGLGADAFSAFDVTIPGYKDTDKKKGVSSTSTRFDVGSNANFFASQMSGLWRSTAAITRIDLLASADNFKAGSVFSLYGLM